MPAILNAVFIMLISEAFTQTPSAWVTKSSYKSDKVVMTSVAEVTNLEHLTIGG